MDEELEKGLGKTITANTAAAYDWLVCLKYFIISAGLTNFGGSWIYLFISQVLFWVVVGIYLFMSS